MKLFTCLPLLPLMGAILLAEEAIDADRAANLVILDETAVKNLRIETVMAEEQAFESTVFAIGRIEEIPAHHSSVSSRISGRAIEVKAFVGDQVKKGQLLVQVESRQAGNPPPTVSLKALNDGLVISSQVHVGQPVEPSMELMDISDRSEMWAVAKIPEQAAASIKIGTKAHVRIPALGGKRIEATLTRYGVKADRSAGAIEGIFQIPNPGGKLHPGMRVEFSLVISSREEVMAVPRKSVQGDPTRRVVYVKDFDLPNAFLKVPVHLGEQNDEYVEVISGLLPGDDVVTQGAYSLGFAGGGSGISLKEALDAAHGHEHNEDGSELTDAQKKPGEDDHDGHDHGAEASGFAGMQLWLLIYCGLITLLVLIMAQKLWNNRKKSVTA